MRSRRILIDFHLMPFGFAGEFLPERTALGEQKRVAFCNCIRVVLTWIRIDLRAALSEVAKVGMV